MFPKKYSLEKFGEGFPTPLYYRLPKSGKSDKQFWVFWSQDDDHHDDILQQQQQGFQMHNHNDPFSANIMSRRMISDKIKHALSSATWFSFHQYIVQFWAPVMTISGRRLLSTSGQPFAVNYHSKSISKYRLRCMEYQYSINHDHDDDPAAMIISDAPISTAFLKRLPQIVSFATMKGAGNPLVDSALDSDIYHSYMLPICYPPQTPSSCCVGVLELSMSSPRDTSVVNSMIRALKGVDLGVFQIQERIPYQIIHGLEPARDEIEHALLSICKSSNKPLLAQVWIAFEDDNNMSFSSYSEATRKKQMLYVKLTGYNPGPEDPEGDDSYLYNEYYRLCDLLSLEMGEGFVEKTLQDHKPRFCYDVLILSDNKLVKKYFFPLYCSTLAICLNSIHTGDFCYAFEFVWWEKDLDSNAEFLGELLNKIVDLMPRLELASGAIVGDEIDLIMVGDPTRSQEVIEQQFGNTETEAAENLKDYVKIIQQKLGDEKILAKLVRRKLVRSAKPDLHLENSTSREKIFQECIPLPQPEALARGKKAMVENCITALEKKYKTAPIILSQKDIEDEYGKTMKEAAKALGVSLSTLKRKCKDVGISEWRGPGSIKRKVKDSINQSEKNEEYGGAVQEPLAIKQNESTLTIKAEYKEDTFKFQLCISEATFIFVEEKIGKKCKLTHGTYKLNYLDEDEEWIVLASDEDMTHCIKSSRNLGKNVVRLRVLPSTQPISG